MPINDPRLLEQEFRGDADTLEQSLDILSGKKGGILVMCFSP